MRPSPPAWLWALPVFTCGLLAAVPPFVLALRLRTRSAWLWFGVFAALTVASYTLIGAQPDGPQSGWDNLGAILAIANFAGSAVYSTIVGRDVYAAPAAMRSPADWANAAAVQGVHAARQRRAEALAIVVRDPQMARDLRIGRPDLPRHYDDGGLVDLNSAPAPTIATWLGLSEPQARSICDVRQQLGRFERGDDVLRFTDLEPATFDRVADRIVLL